MKLKNNIAVSESGFVFDPNSGESFSLNKTAREIVNLLNEGKLPAQIKAIILAKYDVDELVYSRFFDDFTQMLRHFNLIEKEN